MDFMTGVDPEKAAWAIVATLLALALLYKDARRLSKLTDLYARTRSPLAAASLVGAAATSVGTVMMVLGAYRAVAAPPMVVMPAGVVRLVVTGGALVILGWATRIVAWTVWKRRYGPGGVPPARGEAAAAPPDGSAEGDVQDAARGGQSGKGRRRRK
jgi:hypothetical protein